MLKKIILFLLFLIGFMPLFGQVEEDAIDSSFTTTNLEKEIIEATSNESDVNHPSLVFSSPTASEFGKFGYIHSSVFTGAMNYNIPLFQLNTQYINLPITLNYYSNGFLVDKIPSWVGFDWSLFAGGIITRMVKGIPDDIGGIDRTSFPVNIEDYINNGLNYTSSDYDAIVNHFLAYDYEDQDYEPDLYSFNFTGNSGMFYIDNNDSIVTIPFQKLDIGYFGATETFEIIDPEGIKYVFTGKESSRNTNAEGYYAGKSSYVTYYLTQIIHPTGEYMHLFYDSPYQYTFATGISHRLTYVPSVTNASCQYIAGNNPDPEPILTEIMEVVLDSIVAPNYGKLVFNRSNGSLGVYGDRLNSIDYFDKNNDFISSANFYYQFPNTTSFAGGLPDNVSKSTTRMFLDSLVMKDNLGKSIKK